MNGPERLKAFHNNWPTDKGTWIPGGKVFYRDKSLFDDFAGEQWSTLLVYGVRGVMPSIEEVKMVEHFATICCSYPDPRLWNNRVASLCGTTRSTGVLALSAATAISEATIFGRRADVHGAAFLEKTRSALAEGKNLDVFIKDYLREKRVIPGFGRPIIKKDERIAPLLKEASKLGFGDGYFVSLISQITESLERQRYRMKPNISIHCAAISLDMGWSLQEAYLLAILTFTGGILPCYIDGSEKPEGVFLPLTCGQIDYKGVSDRRYNNETD